MTIKDGMKLIDENNITATCSLNTNSSMLTTAVPSISTSCYDWSYLDHNDYDNYISNDNNIYDYLTKLFNDFNEVSMKNSSAANNNCCNAPSISRFDVFNSGEVTTVVAYFNDGTKEVSVCQPGDEFDLRIGLELCMLKKVYGKRVHSIVDSVIKKHNNDIKAAEEEERAAKARAIIELRKAQKLHDKKIKREARRQLEIKKAMNKLLVE